MEKLSDINQGYMDSLIRGYLALDLCRKEIVDSYFLMEECYENGGKVLIAGNGGSAVDSEHIVGELMKRFQIPRPVDDTFAVRRMLSGEFRRRSCI